VGSIIRTLTEVIVKERECGGEIDRILERIRIIGLIGNHLVGQINHIKNALTPE